MDRYSKPLGLTFLLAVGAAFFLYEDRDSFPWALVIVFALVLAAVWAAMRWKQ